MKHLVFLLIGILGINELFAQSTPPNPNRQRIIPIPNVLFEGELAERFAKGELLQSPSLKLSKEFDYFEDQNGQMTFNSIRLQASKFKEYSPDNQSLNSKSIYWFRLNLQNLNSIDGNQDLIIQLNSLFDYIDCYLLHDQSKEVIHYQSGQKTSPKHKNLIYPMGQNAFIIPVNPAKKFVSIYFRVDQRDHIGSGWTDVKKFSARLYNRSFVEKDLQEIYRIDILYLGIFLSFSLYHLLLFASSREKEYLYYALSILFISLWTGADRLVLYEYVSGFMGYGLIKPLSTFGSAFCLIQFTRIFLNLKNHHPYINKVFIWGQYLLWIMPVYILFREFIRPEFLIEFAGSIRQMYFYYQILMGVFFISLIIMVSYRLSQQGYPPARFYFYSFTIFFVLILAVYLVIYLSQGDWLDLNILKINAYITYFNISANSLILFVFSLAIGDKMNRLQKDKLEAIEKNLLLQKDINTTLEHKVAERTQQLKKANKSLQFQNYQLGELNEELNTLNDEKDNLIKIVAHNLGTPLAANNMYLGLLLKHGTNLNEDQQEYVSTIKTSNQNLITMINRILDVSHIEGTTVKLNPEEVQVDQALNEVAKNFYSIAQQKNIEIIKSYQAEGCKILADRSYFIQIIENLLGNAIKFSDYNKKIFIETESTSSQVIISIKDQGPGIKAEEKNKMFKIYQMLSAKPTAGENSTGLGLYIVKKYTEAMQGDISETGKEGEGANFVLKFNKIIP